jgi:hypothetical protein
MRKSKLLLTVLTGATLISCAEPTSPVRSSVRDDAAAVTTERPSALKNLRVEGALSDGGTFVGKLTATSFSIDETTRQLFVTGVLDGQATSATGKKTHVKNQAFTAPVDLSRTSDVASVAGDALVRPASMQVCDVLFLDLGPLFLDVLGLTVDLNEVVLDINAVGGAGNLVGNLLCGLLSLLDGFAALALIGQILEQINAILQGLGGIFPIA